MKPLWEKGSTRPKDRSHRYLVMGVILSLFLSQCICPASTVTPPVTTSAPPAPTFTPATVPNPAPTHPALPTAGLTQAALVTGSGWEVHTLAEDVQASVGQISPLTFIPRDQTNPVFEDGYVWTGYEGMAELTRPETPGCMVFAYNRSGIFFSQRTVVSRCPNEAGLTCGTGMAITEKDCSVSIATPTTQIELTSTWVTIIYIEEYQLTLVLAHEGEAYVRPLVPVADGGSTQPFMVPGGNFAYTLPVEQGQIAGALNGWSYRCAQPFPITDITPLAALMGISPLLQEVDQLMDSSGLNSQLPQEARLPISQLDDLHFVVYGRGPNLDDPNNLVRAAVRLAVNWRSIAYNVTGDDNNQFMGKFGRNEPFELLDQYMEGALQNELTGTPLEVVLNSDLPGANVIWDSLVGYLSSPGFDLTFTYLNSAESSRYFDSLDYSRDVIYVTSH